MSIPIDSLPVSSLKGGCHVWVLPGVMSIPIDSVPVSSLKGVYLLFSANQMVSCLADIKVSTEAEEAEAAAADAEASKEPATAFEKHIAP